MNGDESFNGPNVVPLRTILRKFLSLVDNYEARRNGGLDSYDSEFQELKQFSENLKADPDHVCREGERNVNRKKNRYKDILPYDFSRVILSDYGDVPGSDYINANFIKGASGSSAYIACQGPLPHTVNDFWRMVVECEVQVIVMACNEQESGKHKCENYWVEEDGVEREFGQVTVWLKKCRNVCPDFLVRTMRIRFTNSRGESEERNVCQFHYSAWPDHGVPTKVRPLLDMVRLIRDCQTSETLPVLVHCSAGCGRTGTICAIDYVWGLLRLGRLTPEFSLFTLVRDMRSQRIAMVQTKDQYILVHRAVKELFQEQLKIIDAHPYANVDENGLPLEIKRELQEPTYETLEFKPPFKSPSAFLVDSDKKKNSDYADTGSSNIVVSVSNVNTHINVNSNNNHNPSILPLPALPPKTKTTDIPSSSPLSSTGSGSVGASGEESRSKISVEKSLPSSATGSGSVRIANNNNSNSISNGGHVLQSSSSSNEDRDEKEKQLLKSLTSTFTVSSSDSSSTDKPSTSNGNNPKSSHSNNPLRSALLRKPSISKLKSFFEKTPKEEKDKDVKKSGSTQLSRAKSDVSTRFHAFKDFTSSFTSRTPPPPSPLTTKTIPTPTTTASSSSSSPEKDSSILSSELSSKSTENTNVGILGNENHKRTVESSNSKIQMLIPSKKPAIPSSKPILSIKRSKSLKVPSKLTTTTINYQNNMSGLDIGGISSNSTANKSGKDKDKEVHHYHSQISNSVNSSSSGASGSSSGFSSTIADNPIKVCVKQVEIPKLQSVVSKSIKPEVLLATSTANTSSSSRLAKAPPSSQEYDYDIDDRSHLRSQKPMSTSSSSVFQLQQESFQPSNSVSSSPETKTNTKSGNSNSISNSNPLPSSRIHILKDNHNYANVIYGNSNSNHSAATSSSNNNHQRSSSSRSQTMEDIQNFPSSRDSNEQSNQRGGGGELKFHGKLKKCDTVNPRILAASLGYTIPGHERSSILTRSQSHVWQPEKLTSSSSSHLSLQQQQQTPHPHQQQQSLPVRVFSSDNIHQPSLPPPSFSSLSNSNDRNRNSSSPSKTINMGTGSGLGIDYPVIMRKPKHTSITTNQNHRKPIRESNNDDIVDSNNAFVQAASVIDPPSPVTASATASNSSNYQNHVDSEIGKGYHSRESSLDKTSTFNYSQHSVNSNSNGSSSGSNGKPVVRRRVPKTNPYANYPACVTGSNSNFPYKLPKSNQITGTGSGAEDMSTSGSSNNYNHIMSGSSNNFGGYSTTPSNELVHTNHHQHYRKDSNSSIPILKPSYGGSIGNSSESSSNTETPRNSLPSTPTQSVDVLYPQLHRNNSNNSNPLSTFPSQNLVRQQQQQQQSVINNNYESTSSGSGSSYSQNSYKSNPKSILKEQMLQQQQQISHHIATPVAIPIPVNIETSEKSENLRNFHQLQPPPPPPQPPPLPPPTTSTSNNTNSNPSSSHIPKISTVRIAVGVRERRNSFRQAVWKEAPNNSNEAHNPAAALHENPRNLIPSQNYSNDSSSFNNSVATPRNNNNSSTPFSAAPSSISQIPALPKIHQNYEPIWPESLSNHNYNHNNQTNPFQAMPVLHPANSNSKAKMNNSYSNSSTFPHNENSKLNSSSNSKSNSIQDQSQSSQKSLQNPAFQTKVDEIKVMLAELDAPVGVKFPNKTNTPGQGSSGTGTTTSLKQQRSLRAPSRSQYQQQGLSCFTFKKPSSYESLVDQLHQEQEQQELEDSDEYQPLINNTGTSSSSMGSTTGIIGIGPSAASIRKDFLYHPPSMRDNVESTSTSRNSNFSRGPHAQANDYVTLRQCRTVTDNHNLNTSASNQNHNNNSNSNHVANASRQSSSSSPDFPKKFSMNSSSSGSPLGSSSNTPVPPPRSKAKRGVVGVGGGQSSHSSSKSPTTNNYDRDFQTDFNNTSLSHPAWAASASYNTKMNYYPIPINTVPNANMSTSNNSELPRPHHPYEEYHDVGHGLGPGQGQIQQNPRDHHSSGDDAGGNVNSNSITTSTSPKAIIRALGLFQAKAANVRSRFANWTEAKDRSLGNANKLVHENGNGPPLDQSNGNGNGYGKEDIEGSKGDHIMTGAGAGGSGNLGSSSRSENNQLPTTISGTGHILGRSKHQYL